MAAANLISMYCCPACWLAPFGGAHGIKKINVKLQVAAAPIVCARRLMAAAEARCGGMPRANLNREIANPNVSGNIDMPYIFVFTGGKSGIANGKSDPFHHILCRPKNIICQMAEWQAWASNYNRRLNVCVIAHYNPQSEVTHINVASLLWPRPSSPVFHLTHSKHLHQPLTTVSSPNVGIDAWCVRPSCDDRYVRSVRTHAINRNIT